MAPSKPPAGDSHKVIGYIRASTDEQRLGPEAQRAALQRWCDAQGATLVACFEDLGVSGASSLDKRPGLVLALDALAHHGAGVLLVAKRDRLARDVMTAAYVEGQAKKHGATLVSAAGEGEGDDPSAKLMRHIVNAFAEYEREVIIARTKAALSVKKARGDALGNAPYGFRFSDDGQTFVEDPPEQATLKQVKALRAEGRTVRATLEEATQRGLRSRTGKAFTLAALHKMSAA